MPEIKLADHSEQLQSTIETHLIQLNNQSSALNSFQSKLSILLRTYKLNASYFDYAATWFGELYWWQKIGMGLALIVLVGLVAAIFELLALSVIITSTICLSSAFFLTNHYHAIKQQEQRIIDGIDTLEKDSKLLSEALLKLHKKLSITLNLMHQQITDLIADAELRKQQAQQLHEEINNFKLSIASLQLEKDNLQNTHQQLTLLFHTISHELKIKQEELADKIRLIEQLSNNLQTTQTSLLQNQATLSEIEASYQQQIEKFRNSIHEMTDKINFLQEQLSQETEASTSLMTTLATADQTIAKTSAAIAAAKKAILDSNECTLSITPSLNTSGHCAEP